jgi:benzoate membrane transport protein
VNSAPGRCVWTWGPMSFAPLLAGLTAALVGFGGSVAVVFSACVAAGASADETASWIAALCIAIAVSSGFLSWRHRMPLITAWSTPGAALIAATPGLTLSTAVGAFLVAALLIILTALFRPLGRLVERLPLPIASAMLAGVLLKFVVGPFESVGTFPMLIVPLIALFLMARLIAPSLAVIAVLVAGGAWAAWLGLVKSLPPLMFTKVLWITPTFEPAVALGLGVPLYLVTMASQNLAGFAVLRAFGYAQVPASPILATTGALSLLTAPFGAHTSNLAAISAALCTGPDCHPDPTARWPAGVAYMIVYFAFAAIAPTLVALFVELPVPLVRTVAGLALAGAMIGALTSAFAANEDPFPAGLTFAVTVSGLTAFGIGAAFWGLAIGLLTSNLARSR